MNIICLWIYLSGLFVYASSTPVNSVCQTLGKSYKNVVLSAEVYTNKKEQKCEIPLGGGNFGIYSYIVNQKSIPIVDNAAVIITKPNLDKGSVLVPSGDIYAVKMGGSTAIAVQILGYKLGGSGRELANIIPMVAEARVLYQAFEDTIYDCLKNKDAKSASLRWQFEYKSPFDTKAFTVRYDASFVGKKTCSRISQTFIL